MDVSQLKTFIAVVDHHSFSEAARLLGISQPAVTMQIQALEADVGATLLDRGYRKVELTEAGRTLLPYARRVLGEMDGARTALEAMSDMVSGRLVLAASTTPGQYVLPRILGRFLRDFPEVGVTLRVYDTADVVTHVEAGEADLGMIGAEIHGARVHYEKLGHDDLVLICPPDHRLARHAPASFADLTDEPFIVREAGSGTRMVAEDVIRRGGVDPAELKAFVEAGGYQKSAGWSDDGWAWRQASDARHPVYWRQAHSSWQVRLTDHFINDGQSSCGLNKYPLIIKKRGMWNQ